MRNCVTFLGASLSAITTAASAAETIHYSYDARGRLIVISRSGSVNNEIATNYAFDKANNRTQVTVTGSTGGTPGHLVASPSFEEPEVGNNYSYNPTVSGTSFLSFAGVAGNGSDWGFSPAPDGDQVAFLRSDNGGTGSISQSVTGLTTGASYAVSFFAAQRPGYASNPVTVRVNGVDRGTFTPQSSSFAQFTTSPFIAGGSTATVEFSGQASSVDAGSGLDKVMVVIP